MIAAYYGGQFQMIIVLAATFPAMFLFAAARGPRAGGTTSAIAVTLLAILWIAFPFAHAVLLRQLPLHGGALVIDVLVATFLTDTAAYAGGRLFGRHPLAPRISPNKTIEGLVIGMVTAVLSVIAAGLYQDWLSLGQSALLGLAVAVMAPLGDLFESQVKRDAGTKDAGRLFGVHGGALDRLDAAFFALVAGYYVWQAML